MYACLWNNASLSYNACPVGVCRIKEGGVPLQRSLPDSFTIKLRKKSDILVYDRGHWKGEIVSVNIDTCV